jgi:hypothetical protein
VASIPELLDGHITLEVECLDRRPTLFYLNGYIGKLATADGLVTSMHGQLGKPIPSPVKSAKKFRDAVKSLAQRKQIPVHPFTHKFKKEMTYIKRLVLSLNVDPDCRFFSLD